MVRLTLRGCRKGLRQRSGISAELLLDQLSGKFGIRLPAGFFHYLAHKETHELSVAISEPPRFVRVALNNLLNQRFDLSLVADL